MDHAVAVAPGTEHVDEEHERAKLGTWLFLASEIMFFSGFIGAFIVLKMSRPADVMDNSHLSKIMAGINTIALICSSFTMVLAVDAAKKGKAGMLRLGLLLTALLGCVFLVVKYFEYTAKFTHTEVMDLKKEDLVKEVEERKKEQKFVILAEAVKAGDETFPKGAKLTDEQAGKIVDAEVKQITVEHPLIPSTNVFYAAYFTMTGFHGFHVLGGIVAMLILLANAAKWGPTNFTHVECVGLYWHFVDVVWIFLFPMLYLMPPAKMGG